MFRFSPTRTPPNWGRLRLNALVVSGLMLPVLMLLGLASYMLLQSRAQHEQRATMLTQNLAEALEHSVAASVEKIDMTLGAIASHLEDPFVDGRLENKAVAAHLRWQMRRRSELESIRVTDRHGVGLIASGPSPDQRVSFADQEWFTNPRDRADSGLYMSRPTMRAADGAWIVQFSRSYRTPQGEFAGCVSATMPLKQWDSLIAATSAGNSAGNSLAISLRYIDLGLIARAPSVPGLTGSVGNKQVSEPLKRLVESGAMRGSYRAVSSVDTQERRLSFRRLSAVPMLVNVGLSSEDYLTDWRREVRTVGGLCALVLLIYAVGAALSWRLLRQNRQARLRIELLAKVFEHSGEAIVVTDAEHRVVEVNPGFMRQTGYQASEVLGKRPASFDTPRNRPGLRELVYESIAATGVWRGEVWDRSKDGRDFPKWLSVSVLRDASGRITHHIANSIDVSETKQAEEQVRHLALHDMLTQLPNRMHLHDRLEQALASARSDGGEVALLFIDMDRFKNINDTLGHQVGDGLLQEVGRRLRGLVRGSDVVARLGGDEFVLVLTGIGQAASLAATAAAAAVATKVVTALGLPYFVHGHQLHSTPSIGIAVFPGDGDDADTLMKNADAAMYHAKSAGRNNFQFFTSAMNQATQERLALEAGLRGCIERGELFLHYQPQRDLHSGRVIGLEALVRWQHPQMGMIPPLKFIPVAEDTGQIQAIGAWVLDEALRTVAVWRAEGHAGLRVAVNLSAQQLRGDGMADQVARALLHHGLPGAALELEITESMAMQDPAHTAELLRQLRHLGVALAVDDFGTGYSSLAYLKQLPLSCLKLDRSFVMDIENDANDAAICTATIQMAHSLGLGVVAEGVETATQLEFLRRLGCDLVQGYHISKPLSVVDCTRFLKLCSEPAEAMDIGRLPCALAA